MLRLYPLNRSYLLNELFDRHIKRDRSDIVGSIIVNVQCENGSQHPSSERGFVVRRERCIVVPSWWGWSMKSSFLGNGFCENESDDCSLDSTNVRLM